MTLAVNMFRDDFVVKRINSLSALSARDFSTNSPGACNYDPKPAAREQSRYREGPPLDHKHPVSLVLNGQDASLSLLSV